MLPEEVSTGVGLGAVGVEGGVSLMLRSEG